MTVPAVDAVALPTSAPTDAELLARTAGGDRRALGQLAARYVDLVYAAAVRQLVNRASADDVTQAVFLVLARKAGSVRGGSLPAWLVQTTRFAAANVQRSERRQRRRERAVARPEVTTPPEMTEADPLLPMLDDAIASLAAADRTAVVHRFLLGADFTAVAAALGTSTEAARKRTDRAIDKLRGYFAGRGVVAGAGALAATLLLAAPSPAPAAVVTAVTSAAASPALATGSSAVAAKGVLATYSGLKAAVVAVAAVIVVAGVTVTASRRHAAQPNPTVPTPSPSAQGGPAAARPTELPVAPLPEPVLAELFDARPTMAYAVSTCADQRGVLWVGTEGNGVHRFDPSANAGDRWSSFGMIDGLGDGDIYAVAVDPKGRVWAGTRAHGVSVYDGQAWHSYGPVVDGPVRAGPIGERVFAVAICPTDGDVWMATNAGLARYSQRGDRWSYFGRPEGLPGDDTNCIAFDPAGNILVGTLSHGIAMADATDGYGHWRSIDGPIETPTVESGAGLPSNMVNGVAVEPDGTAYVGTPRGLAWSGDHGRSWRFLRGDDWVDKVRDAAVPPPADWSATPDTPLAEDWVQSLSVDGAGHLYVGFRSMGLVRYDRAPGGEPTDNGTTLMTSKSPVRGLPASMDGLGVAATYGTALLPVGPGSVSGRIDGGPAEVAPMPASAESPDLNALVRTLPVADASAPQTAMAWALDDDWQTRGDWMGRFGRFWCAFPAMSEYHYFWGSGAGQPRMTSAMGPHHKPGDSERYYRATLYSSDPRALEIPPVYMDSRVKQRLTTPDVYRRIAHTNDDGHEYPNTWEGPDLHFNFTGVPAGLSVLSIYMMNNDGHSAGTFRNEWRDFPIELHLNGASAPAAVGRGNTFYGGVWKRFLVRGPCDMDVVFRRNYSNNIMVCALALDRPAVRPEPYFAHAAPPVPSLTPAGLVAAALQSADADPAWWAAHEQRLAVQLARWSATQLPGADHLDEIREVADHFAGRYEPFESDQAALGLRTAREIEKAMRWDGVTPNCAGHGRELVMKAMADAQRAAQ